MSKWNKLTSAFKWAAMYPVNTIKASLSKDVLTSPGRAGMLMGTYGLSENTNMGKWYSNQSWSKYSDMAILAAITAATLGAGGFGAAGAGAAGGAAGGAGGASAVGTTGAAAAGTTAGAAATSGMSAAGWIAAGSAAASLAGSVYQAKQGKKTADEVQRQSAISEAVAQQRADDAARESEIMRKQALLASQKSMTARKATAGAIANKLKNTTTMLGSDEEKLGD